MYTLTQIDNDLTGVSSDNSQYTDLDRLNADVTRIAQSVPKVHFRYVPTVADMAALKNSIPVLVLHVSEPGSRRTFYFITNGVNPIRG